MRFTLGAIKFLKWETGIWFGSYTAEIPIVKFELVVLGIGVKLFSIEVG